MGNGRYFAEIYASFNKSRSAANGNRLIRRLYGELDGNYVKRADWILGNENTIAQRYTT